MVTRHISQEDYDILQEAKEIKMKTQGPMSHEEWIHYLFKTVDKQSVEITKSVSYTHLTLPTILRV